MKKVKIIIDIIMFIIMILLMNTNITGLQMHEILGIGIFVIFIIHKILNFKWIKSIGKNIFNKNMQTKSKVQFILDMLLFIFITANVITGVLISKCILTKITISNMKLTTILHKFFAWWSLILISIHIGFHWKSIVNYFTSKFKSLIDNIFVKIILKVVYVVIAILGVISLLKKEVYTNLIPIIDNDNNSKENHRDFEDINKLNSNEINQEKRYKNRPNGSENPNFDKKKKDRNGNSNSTKNYKKDNINEITKANINGISVIDYISIMGLLIGGTYYTIDIIDKKKK